MAAMKWMMYIMPLMFFFIFNEYASGLSYYYFISGLIGILTMWIMRRMTDEKKLLAQLEANKKAPSQQKASGLMAKLEALQKEQERLQKERQERLSLIRQAGFFCDLERIYKKKIYLCKITKTNT